MSRHTATTALKNTMMALPVMAGLAAGQAMAHAPETSIRPQARPENTLATQAPTAVTQDVTAIASSLRPQARPHTLGASDAFKAIYDETTSIQLQRNMDAKLGGNNIALALDWSQLDIATLSTEDLRRLDYELTNYQSAREQGRTSFGDYHTQNIADEPIMANDHQQAQKNIEMNWGGNYARTRSKETEDKFTVVTYGLSDLSEFTSFQTPMVYVSDERYASDQKIMKDYIRRHESCHGLDPALYANPMTEANKETLEISFDNGHTYSLAENYRHYQMEQFADACATLEYALENNQEGLEHMAVVADYRDANSLSNIQGVANISRGLSQQSDLSKDELTTSSMTNYFIRHDTGPSIRGMLSLSSHLNEGDKAYMQQDPQAFDEFVRDVIGKTSMSAEEFKEVALDVMDMTADRQPDLSAPTADLVERGYAGRKTIIEYNMDLPFGSIDALQEVAPQSHKQQAGEAVEIYIQQQNAHPLLYNLVQMPQDVLTDMQPADRLMYAQSFSVARGVDAWDDLRLIDPDLAVGPQDISTVHLESFASRGAGEMMREAGDILHEISDPSFNREEFENRYNQTRDQQVER